MPTPIWDTPFFTWLNRSLAAIAAIAAFLLAVFEPGTAPFWAVLVLGLASVIADALIKWGGDERSASEKEKLKHRVNDVLGPLVARATSMALMPKQKQREESRGLLTASLAAALSLVEAERSRATVFKVTDNTLGSRVMAPIPNGSLGRGDAAKSVFREDTEEGAEVWKRADARESLLCANLAKEKPLGWPPDRERPYKCFVTVPIAVGDEVLGLLTVNSVNPNELDLLDLETARLIAAFVGLAMKYME